jgi:hypothetical protein
MVDLSVIEWLDLAGVFVFASSGALVAARKRLDIFGFVVVGFITAGAERCETCWSTCPCFGFRDQFMSGSHWRLR